MNSLRNATAAGPGEPPAAPGVRDIARGELTLERQVVEELMRGGRWPERAPSRPRAVVQFSALGLLCLYAVWAAVTSFVTPVLAWSLYLVTAAVAIVGAARLGRTALAPLGLLALMWGVWESTSPVWSGWDPTGAIVGHEAAVLGLCATSSITVALLGACGTPGMVRAAWMLVIATVVPAACWEVATRQHFLPAGAAYGPPAFSPSGPLGNPNNLACVLVVCLGVLLGRMTERIHWWYRVSLGVLAAVVVTLIAFTLSRAGLAAAVVVAVGAVGLVAGRSVRHGSRRWDRRVWTVLAALGAATVSVPPLRARNPLWVLVFPGDPETVRSDGLRVRLARIALDQWERSPLTGIGGGRFETLLAAEHPEVGHVVPVHHTFIEILTEYGVVVTAPLVVLLAFVAWTLVSSRRQRAGAPGRDVCGRPADLDTAGTRYLVFVLLVGFVLAGVLMSSALLWPVWWMILACAVALTAHLRAGQGLAA